MPITPEQLVAKIKAQRFAAFQKACGEIDAALEARFTSIRPLQIQIPFPSYVSEDSMLLEMILEAYAAAGWAMQMTNTCTYFTEILNQAERP